MFGVIHKLEQLECSSLNKINVKIMKTAVFSTFVFSMLANAFIYFNFYPQHDSINHAFSFAGKWEVSLGRFLLPLYGKIGGNVTLPWLEGIFSIVFIAFIVYLISEILEFEEKWQIIIISGILSANVCITELASVFIYVLSAYMLSVLLACLGVYFLVKHQGIKWKAAACVCFVCSLGLYQGEIAFAITLLILVLLKDMFANDKLIEVVKKWLPIGITLVCSAIVYYILYKCLLRQYGIEAAKSYNSLSNLRNISWESLLTVGLGRYKDFLNFFFGNGCITGSVITRICNIIFALFSGVVLLKYFFNNKIYWYNKIVIVLIVLTFPAITCMMDILMLREKLDFYILYSLFLYYILCLLIIKECAGDFYTIYTSEIVKGVLMICFGMIMFQNIIFSNQTYVQQKVMYDRALSVTGRILDHVELCPEYEAGVTEVVLIGTLHKNTELFTVPENTGLSGGKKIAITYNQTFGSFVSLLGAELNYTSDEEIINKYTGMDDVINMPSYPNYGYCKMINGKMVIKLSE